MRTILYSAPVILLALSGTAHAVPISESLLGTVTSGVDAAGLFGTVGASLVGRAIDVNFAYNSSTFLSVGGNTYITPGFGLGLGATVNGTLFEVSVVDQVTAGSVGFNAAGTLATLDVPQGSGGLAFGSLSLATIPLATLTSITAATGPGSGGAITLSAGQGFATDTLSYTLNAPTSVPEPASFALLGAGLCGIGLAIRWARSPG